MAHHDSDKRLTHLHKRFEPTSVAIGAVVVVAALMIVTVATSPARTPQRRHVDEKVADTRRSSPGDATTSRRMASIDHLVSDLHGELAEEFRERLRERLLQQPTEWLVDQLLEYVGAHLGQNGNRRDLTSHRSRPAREVPRLSQTCGRGAGVVVDMQYGVTAHAGHALYYPVLEFTTRAGHQLTLGDRRWQIKSRRPLV